MRRRRTLWRFREQTALLICLAGPALIALGFVLLLLREQINDPHWTLEIVGFEAFEVGVLWTLLSLPFCIFWLIRVWDDRTTRTSWLLIVFLGTFLSLALAAIFFATGFLPFGAYSASVPVDSAPAVDTGLD